MNKNTKQKRKPNSATSGGMAFGKISRRMIHQMPSPRSRAASTYSMTSIFMATARDRRYTRVDSSSATTTTKAVMEVPTTDNAIRAKIRVGKAIKMSIIRLRIWSVQPPSVAAKNPQRIPKTNAIAVVIKAIKMVLRAPHIIRVNISRPR